MSNEVKLLEMRIHNLEVQLNALRSLVHHMSKGGKTMTFPDGSIGPAPELKEEK